MSFVQIVNHPEPVEGFYNNETISFDELRRLNTELDTRFFSYLALAVKRQKANVAKKKRTIG